MIPLPLIILILITCVFTFTNGFKDGCSVVAAIISSRSMDPKKAVILACVTEFVSPIISGTAVAATIGKGIVANEFIQSKGTRIAYIFILSAILGAIIWNLVTWYFSIPSSSSHALVGGLIGSGICIFGTQAILWSNIALRIVLVLLLTPLLGLVIGLVFIVITNRICRKSRPDINKFFKTSQIFSVIFLAYNHSTNDAQKSMGIITLIMVICGVQSQFYVPLWVKLLSSFIISTGLLLSGWRIIKTVGQGIFKMKPIHSFVSQLSSALVIYVSGIAGSPVSTTQIVSSSIMGVGAGEKFSAVKWKMAKNIIMTWFTTIPAAAVMSALIYFIVIQF